MGGGRHLTARPLVLGPLAVRGFNIQRSGIRWRFETGHRCRAGDVVAFCNIALTPIRSMAPVPTPFADEARDLQVAFAVTAGGRLDISADSREGGWLDQLPFFQSWSPDFAIGHLECDSDVSAGAGEGEQPLLRPMFAAGRRANELAEVRSGLLTGWHDRSRAWWGDGDFATLLSVGLCEQNGVVRGETGAFLEFFAAVRGPAHVVYVPDSIIVPCAALLYDQLVRTPQAREDIAQDFAESLLGRGSLSARDWMFAGPLLAGIQASPLNESYDLLGRGGVERSPSAQALLLSLSAESRIVLRHRRLGYILNCHGFRVAEAGPRIHAWLRERFEPVTRTPEDIKADYRRLIDALVERGTTSVLVQNVMSTSAAEDLCFYAAYDKPMSDVLVSVMNKTLNLMLHDLTRERDMSIVDIDAIAAELGASTHLPDGIHGSGAMQSEVRSEILRILRARGLRGFA